MRTRRAALTQDVIDRDSQAIAQRLLALPFFSTPRIVSSFVSFKQEVATAGLNAALKERGHELCLPVVSPDVLGEMELYGFDLKAEFIPNRFGIREPPALPEHHIAPEQLEAVILPLTAFDAGGQRLGMGGGYYDRLLKKVRPQCLLIGIAFDFQEAEEIPAEPWDMPLHEVVTPTRHLICRR